MLHMSFRGVQRVPSNVVQVRKGRRSCLRHLLRLLFELRSRARPDGSTARTRAEGAAILASMPRIYTKTGDDGTTGLLYGAGSPRPISCPRPAARSTRPSRCSGSRGRTRATPRFGRAPGAAAGAVRRGRGPRDQPATSAARLEPGVSLVSPEMVARLESRIDELVAAHPLAERASSSPARTPSRRSSTSRGARSVRAERRVVGAPRSRTPSSTRRRSAT